MLPTKGRWLERSLFVGLLLAVTALVCFLVSSWRPSPSYFVLSITVATIVVAVVGDPPLSKREKFAWLCLTGVLALLAFIAMKRADDDSTKARDEEHKSFARLLSSAEDVISNMTGGDSFAYVDLDVTEKPPKVTPVLRVVGRYPLRDVQLRIVDIEKDAQLRSYAGAVSVSEWVSAKYKKIIPIARVTAANPMILDETSGIDTNPATEKVNIIEISASNGTWEEILARRKIHNRWEKGILVLEVDSKNPRDKWNTRKREGFPMPGFDPDIPLPWPFTEPRPVGVHKMDMSLPELPAR